MYTEPKGENAKKITRQIMADELSSRVLDCCHKQNYNFHYLLTFYDFGNQNRRVIYYLICYTFQIYDMMLNLVGK